jgi:SAM-dependent methyltransferase
MMEPTIQEQAGKLVAQAAGYVGIRVTQLGLRHGFFGLLDAAPQGLTPEELAEQAATDVFYTRVWCQGAVAAEVVDTDGERYTLAAHYGTILLDRSSPAYAAGTIEVLGQPEIFDRFGECLTSAEGLWWDRVGPAFIDAVRDSGTPFNVRLVPGGLSQIPGLLDRLGDGPHILELACGAGVGLVRLAEHFPAARLVGVDGDAHSLDLARKRVDAAGVGDRVELVRSTLEDYTAQDAFDLVTINISMHECRDIERVTEQIRRALRDGGTFVISDFPFPETVEGLRTPPGRVMAGVQFFEALIGDQLLPTSAFVDLLERHGFSGVGAIDVTPVHAITYARA